MSDSMKPSKSATPKAPKAKVAKAKEPKPKEPKAKAPKTVKAVKAEDSNLSASERGFDVNERYSKKSDLEHVLLRPDTYIGGTDKIEREEWIWDSSAAGGGALVFKKISFSPGLFKIVDEVLVNARDHTERDKSCNKIKVDLNTENGEISVENNGAGIPIEWHKDGDCYLAEMIFGMFKTGENFSDDEKKTVGGRNGFGAKLANAFSERFHIDTVDKVTGKRYTQLWEKNMSFRHDPVITSCSKAGYTKVTFLPDYKRFGGSAPNEAGFLGLVARRVYDMAACTREEVLIYLNGEKINIRTFNKYIEMFLGASKTENPRIIARLEDESEPATPGRHWDIGVALSDDGGFKQFSLVNGISTSQGGTHVAYIREQIVTKVCRLIREKNPNDEIKPGYVRENLWVFVNAVVENPAFTSQTKETLSTEPEKFGFKNKISQDIIASIEKKLKISKRAIGVAGLRVESALKKTDGRKKLKITGILKLEDALQAAKKRAKDCCLIVTEGDSAKTLAMDGLQIIGRDLFGIFPLRGKFINATNASADQLMANAEHNAVKEIMGFKEGADYEDDKQFATLRYGSMMLMTDQDVDGYHIKGLFYNWIIKKWPSLLKRHGFFKCFVTPIVRLQPILSPSASAAAKKKAPPAKLFFNMGEFEEYRLKHGLAGMNVRYLKGLGTSEKSEAREYFADFNRFVKVYLPSSEQQTIEQFDHAFSENYANWRKEWLEKYNEMDLYDYNSPVFKLDDFIDKELKHFSIYDNKRSLGHSMDGLKVSQRKILWALRKIGLWNKTKKVLAVAGDISSLSSYHHGEKSLMDTTVGMAQTFVDSNNINLLYPSGQFGSRLDAGKDAADPRYIYTSLNKITGLIVRAEDDGVLQHEQDDEGKPIEPQYFSPIIPMVLVNGCQGIGTGYSTFVPMYNPVELIDHYIDRLSSSSGKSDAKLKPWYNNFAGKIEEVPDNEGVFDTFGNYERVDDVTIRVTEVPIGQSFNGYKAFIEDHLMANLPTGITDQKKAASAQAKHFIKDYESKTFTSRCNFTMVFENKATVDEMVADPKGPKGVFKRLRLTSRLSTKNMYLFGTDGAIKKFASPQNIIDHHIPVRSRHYEQRKQLQLEAFDAQIAALSMRQRFIELVLDGTIEIRNKTKKSVAAAIIANGLGTASVDTTADSGTEECDQEFTPAMRALLKISLFDITKEEVDKFINKIAKLRADRQTLADTPINNIWLSELQELRQATIEHLKNSSLESEDQQLAELMTPKAKVAVVKAKPKATIKSK